MDKENQLIYEAYLKENPRDLKKIALAIMCAIGATFGSGCKTYRDASESDKIWMDQLLKLPFNFLFSDKELTPEQQRKLQIDIENVLQHKDVPEGGWEEWLKTWKANNVA